ncbi:MAG: diguanylate cyclase (GGDEF)-like protein/PAS domain S-box-containing protein [Motiliproteus sp.]|jgi:diguanylate cyclase (GGDEF)-like protein/PAS domain S-box-containing protein
MDINKLRRLAESSNVKTKADFAAEVAALDTDEILNLVQELHTHQVELELQNEELRGTQLELLDSRNRYSELYDFAPVGYLTLSPHGVILEANLGSAEMLGITRSQLLEQRLSTFFHAQAQDEVFLYLSSIKKTHIRQRRELRLLDHPVGNKDTGADASLWVRLDGKPTLNVEGEIDCIYLSLSDITEQRHAYALLERQALYDTLTGLPNRQLLLNRLGLNLAHLRRGSNHGSLLYIDIDNFKQINDSFGHATGDRVLQHVAEVLRVSLRAEDTAARLGGDEFVVLLTELDSNTSIAAVEAEAIANKIKTALLQTLVLEDYSIQTEVSIGIVLFPNGAKTIDEIFSHADIAMYRVKRSGDNGIGFYHKDIHEKFRKRLEISQNLRLALSNHEFELFYQPQVDLYERILGAECLLRWQHPLKGMILPGEFISIMEDSSLIMEVGTWVLTHACKKLAQWEALGPPFSQLSLAVNVSPKQFNQGDFFDRVEMLVQQTGANPKRLVLEITESMLLTHIETTIERMKRLQHLGVMFSIDDFGTGYSSLSYIKRLPIDTLKIDQSFVRNIHLDADNAILVDTILSMAEHLKLKVIAEGVETAAEQAPLIAKGCRYFQGYLFSYPLPCNDFERLVQSRAD